MPDWDTSLVDPTDRITGDMIIRSVGGRSGPIALENGAKITFPWKSQQQAGHDPSEISSTEVYSGFHRMLIRGPKVTSLGTDPDARRASISLNAHASNANTHIQLTAAPTDGDVGTAYIGITGADNPTDARIAMYAYGSIDLWAGTGTINLQTTGLTLNGGANLLGAWTSYTPVWTQNPGVTILKTNHYSRYIKIGRLVIGEVLLSATSGGSAGSAVAVDLPVAVHSVNGQPIGTGYLYDASGNVRYPFEVIVSTATSAKFIGMDPGLAALIGEAGSGFAVAIATGDSITFNFMYESAT